MKLGLGLVTLAVQVRVGVRVRDRVNVRVRDRLGGWSWG